MPLLFGAEFPVIRVTWRVTVPSLLEMPTPRRDALFSLEQAVGQRRLPS